MKMMYYKFKLTVTVIILWMVLIKDSTLDKLSIKNNNTQINRNKSNDDITLSSNDDIFKATTNFDYIRRGLEIVPVSSEYVLLSNSTLEDHIFTCKGYEPVKWYFEQYDGHLLKKKSKNGYDEVSKRYVTMFSLSRGAYLNTGYYYCAPRNASTELIKQSKNIYIFVQHEEYLFAIPNIKYHVCQDSNVNSFILPCRTTSPGIDVKLKVDNIVGNIVSSYDAKIGFTIYESCGYYELDLFFCVAQKNDIIEERSFLIDIRKYRIDIEPALPEYVLQFNSTLSNHTFTCKGTKSVQWYFEKYDGSLIDKKCRILEENYTDFDNYVLKKYVAELSLSRGSYLDTGYYYCVPWGAGKTTIKLYHKIYIFVQHDTQLLAIPNDNDIITWHDPDIDEVIFPCRPTSRDINVKVLLNGGTDVSDTFRYDERKGFILDEFWPNNYTCVAQRNNTREERIINIRIINLEISPALPVYTLTSNSTEDDRVITCKGYEPVQWYFEQYNGILLQKKSQSTKIFSKDLNHYIYLSLLSLSRTTYLDTGYYYCVPLAVDTKLAKKMKKIYIFVEHETYLFAIPEDYTSKWFSIENDEHAIIIPCRPTSPEINVKLYNDGNDISSLIQYDEKIGFILFLYLPEDKRNFTCVADRNKIGAKLLFIDQIENNLRKYNEYSDYAIAGENVTLNCLTTPLTIFYSKLSLKWIIPGNMKNESERLKIEQQIILIQKSRIQLTIQNITANDEGFYICEIMVDSINDYYLNMTIRYDLKVISPNQPYLNLKLLEDTDIKIRPVGYHREHWKVQVSAYPSAILEWRDPEGNKIQPILEKINVKNNNGSSQLILRDLKLCDSGVYKLIAYNEAETKEINVTLLVEDKPSIMSINSLKSSYLHCELGTSCIFEFRISGYPLPDVKWTIQNCTNNTPPVCEELNTRIINETISLSPVTLKVVLSMNVIENGILILNASNKFGKSIKEYTLLMADEFNGFNIKGPLLTVAGDNVTVTCSASKHSYQNAIIWTYPKTFTKEKVYVIKNNTQFSYHSYLIIEHISIYLNGIISCMVNRKTQSNNEFTETETKSFALKVEEPYEPVMNSSSNPITLQLSGKSVELWCIVTGMPPPSVIWFKDNRMLRLNKSRILMKNLNQTLIIQEPQSEDIGTYIMCNATNKIGSSTLIYYLKEDTRMNDIFFCSILAMLLEAIVIGCVSWFTLEQKLKKKTATYRRKEFEKGTVKSWNPHLGVEEQAHLLPYDNRWEFPIDKIELGEQIASGEFGIVYKAKAFGIIDDNTITTVAIKTVRPTTDPSHRMALASELKIMTHLGRHINIVNVLGACTVKISKKLMVIVEYCCFGSIDRYLQKHKDGFINQINLDGLIDFNIETVSKKQITSEGSLVANPVISEKSVCHHSDVINRNNKPLCTNDLLCWSYQVSRGMDFLASRKILHGDLATRNILLAEENVVKICDFGLAKNMYKNDNYKKTKKTILPIKWLAIESMRDGIFSTASDVWSFGIVLWEMFSLAAVPYPNIQLDDLLNRLVQGYRMEQPIYSNSKIYDIMLDCWKSEPSERPSFSDLVERVGDLLQEGTKSDYIELNDLHMKTLSERLPSTDILSLLAAPSHSNYSLTTSHSCTGSQRKSSVHSININDIEMNAIIAHNINQ